MKHAISPVGSGIAMLGLCAYLSRSMGGLGYMLNHRRVGELAAVSAVFVGAVFAGSLGFLLSVAPRQYFLAFIPAGAVGGVLLNGWIGRHLLPDCRVSVSLLAAGGLLAALSRVQSPWAQITCLVCLGASWGVLQVSAERLQAAITCRRFRRRVSHVTLGASIAAGALTALGLLSWPALRTDPGNLHVTRLAALVIAALWITTVVVRYRRAPMPPAQWFLYQLVYFFAHFWHGLRPGRRGRLPRGGVILAATHVSAVDPLSVQASCRRLLHWMVAREYYRVRGLGWIYRLAGCIPVNRTGQDTAATRQALRSLRNGGVVAIFPYGRIRTGPEDQPEMKEGAALLALVAKAPLVTAWVGGIRHRSVPADLLRPHRGLTVEFGRPIDLSDLYEQGHDRGAVAEAARRLAEALETPPPAWS